MLGPVSKLTHPRPVKSHKIIRRRTALMEPSLEALKLRRMRVLNEIASSNGGGDRAEDLEALREELLRLSTQIEKAEGRRSL